MGRFTGVATLVGAVLYASASYSGPYTDDLSKCLVRSTSSDDQIVFMKWMFSAISLHPAVSSLSSITTEQRIEIDKNAALLFARLLSADCRQQSADAVKYEGAAALQTSFQLLGQVAMRGLMGNTQVAEGIKKLDSYLERDEKWNTFLRDVGIQPRNK